MKSVSFFTVWIMSMWRILSSGASSPSATQGKMTRFTKPDSAFSSIQQPNTAPCPQQQKSSTRTYPTCLSPILNYYHHWERNTVIYFRQAYKSSTQILRQISVASAAPRLWWNSGLQVDTPPPPGSEVFVSLCVYGWAGAKNMWTQFASLLTGLIWLRSGGVLRG